MKVTFEQDHRSIFVARDHPPVLLVYKVILCTCINC